MSDMYVIFLDKNNNKHRIPITIFESRIGRKWQELVKKNQNNFSDKKLHTSISNYTLKDLDRIHKILNDIIIKINQVYTHQLPIFTDPTFLDKDILNKLHEEFEIYGTQVDSLSKLPEFSYELHDNFLLLNEMIHICEDALVSSSRPIPTMGVISDYYPQSEFSDIEEIDKLYLKSDFRWGEIYLGYNTLGKDWLKVYHDNDIEVIEREMVKPQTRFSAEVWMNFGSDDYLNYNIGQFEKWYFNLSDQLQIKVPINSLNKLSLGRFHIGHIEINKDYFLQYHNNRSDWLSPNHQIKKKWNEEVFSTFREIIKIGFYN
jgi:hypothetical protein